MARNLPDLPLDILALVLEQLEDDKPSQCSIGLSCRAWQPLAQAALLRHVDISSHNLGRRPEFENGVMQLVCADYHARFRQRNLVPRQRSFLRTLNARPELARHVKRFTWTLVWLDYDEEELTEADRLTWSVFGSLTNVTTLDLASIHDVWTDNFVRQNPAKLFPAVRDLRLGGWMHRGLVKAIFTSLEMSNLRSLKLDYLQDEGAFPDGAPMNDEFAYNNARHEESTGANGVVEEPLLERQESGEAIIFPGPMWYPLHMLCRGGTLRSLTHLQIKLVCFEWAIDMRNYYTTFAKLAELLAKTRLTLRSVVIAAGESLELMGERKGGGCGTARSRFRGITRPWLILMAERFMAPQLAVLNRYEFPHLQNLRFEGFRVLGVEAPHDSIAGSQELEEALQAIRDCRVVNVTLTEKPNIDERQVSYGYDCNYATFEDLPALLAKS